jgi:hypothetical protein
MAINQNSEGDGIFLGEGATAGQAIFINATNSTFAGNGILFNIAGGASYQGNFMTGYNEYVSGAAPVLTIGQYGRVVIGNGLVSHSATAGSIIIADTNGACTAYTNSSGAATFACTSDERLKTDIVDSTYDGLADLPTYHIKDFTLLADGNRYTGVTAQTLQKTHPDLVSIGEDQRCDGGCLEVAWPSEWKVIRMLQQMQGEIEDIRSRNH